MLHFLESLSAATLARNVSTGGMSRGRRAPPFWFSIFFFCFREIFLFERLFRYFRCLSSCFCFALFKGTLPLNTLNAASPTCLTMRLESLPLTLRNARLLPKPVLLFPLYPLLVP